MHDSLTIKSQQSGFSITELALALLALAALTSIAIPSYQVFVERSRQATAAQDIRRIELAITRFRTVSGRLPGSLANVREDQALDPWGRAYVYRTFAAPADIAAARKDRNLVPLNTDYDLYSVGRDGDSKPPLSAKASKDDVIRANNGQFVGPAEKY